MKLLKQPKEYFDEKFLKTAGGTTVGVWMTCGVLNSLKNGWLEGFYWRWIAFVLSMILSFVFSSNKGSTTLVWL